MTNILEWPGFTLWNAAAEYAIDAAQRSILYCDVMRQRGNQYLEHIAQTAPNVLSFACDLVMDGRKLARPVNYGLVRIASPDDVESAPQKRPFVVIDPRAGHGPGIGGFKADSEIGVVLNAGHPCYFVGFLPDPIPGQTIEDVARAEAAFIERVIALHPEAEGKPAVIGNCQAGWAVMLLAAIRPELMGPMILAGSPLSYWQGVHGANPMRYTGGLLGGSWMADLASDLGNGLFDGTWLVQNFEALNPSNTLWTKQYNLYAKIDTEAPRYLGFEKWWGGHVLLTGEEIRFITEKLFVGNKLASSGITTSDGVPIDLHCIRSPIVVFCSKGDNITPPQQALGWILDLYGSVDEIRSYGQTIVYAVHETIGHLGIFVSGNVARKEHEEFASNIDLIDVLPPGLYEAVLERKHPDDPTAALVHGDYIARFEARTLDDIRAFGGNDAEDQRRFATAERVSEINSGLYRTFVSPFLHAAVSDALAESLRQLHPLRLQYVAASDRNPLMRPVAELAEKTRSERHPASSDNPLLAWQNALSAQIETALDAWRDQRDWLCEQVFEAVYGSPWLQALVGVRGSGETSPGERQMAPLIKAFIELRIEQLRAAIPQGGRREAAIRAMLYCGMADASVDERAFAVLRQIRSEMGDGMPLPAFKQLLREQFFMLLIDEQQALDAIPSMARRDAARIDELIPALRRVLSAKGPLSAERAQRLARVEGLFGEGAAAFRVTPEGDGVSSAEKRGAAPQRPRRGHEKTARPADTEAADTNAAGKEAKV